MRADSCLAPESPSLNECISWVNAHDVHVGRRYPEPEAIAIISTTVAEIVASGSQEVIEERKTTIEKEAGSGEEGRGVRGSGSGQRIRSRVRSGGISAVEKFVAYARTPDQQNTRTRSSTPISGTNGKSDRCEARTG